MEVLQKRPFMQGKAKINICRLSYVAKPYCFIEIIGDTFTQC